MVGLAGITPAGNYLPPWFGLTHRYERVDVCTHYYGCFFRYYSSKYIGKLFLNIIGTYRRLLKKHYVYIVTMKRSF